MSKENGGSSLVTKYWGWLLPGDLLRILNEQAASVMEAWELSCLLFIINSKMEEKPPLDLVGLEMP